jgi:RimJ/RimL family protein N-acetyltransferase
VNGKQEIELGYRFVKEVWGQGYATESALACKDYGFNELKFTRLISLIDPENMASIKVAEKVGLTLEEKTTFHDHDVLVYSISKS